jgi:hypothetical protein
MTMFASAAREAPRGVLSRGGHGGDPLQKLARHHNALVTERERGGARNGVRKVVVPAGRVVDAVPTTARRSALRPAELGDKAWMVEQLDAAAVQQRQKVGVQVGLRFRALLATDALRSKTLHDP